MNFSDFLLAFFKGYSGCYKDLKKMLYQNIEQKGDVTKPKEPTIRTTLNRLKNRGLIERSSVGEWKLTHQGRMHLDGNSQPLRIFHKTPNHQKNGKEVICMFDIPEDERFKRDWLRDQLVNLDFRLLQQSVWIGPAPLPEVFIKYTKQIGIYDHLQLFEVTKKNLTSEV